MAVELAGAFRFEGGEAYFCFAGQKFPFSKLKSREDMLQALSLLKEAAIKLESDAPMGGSGGGRPPTDSGVASIDQRYQARMDELEAHTFELLKKRDAGHVDINEIDRRIREEVDRRISDAARVQYAAAQQGGTQPAQGSAAAE